MHNLHSQHTFHIPVMGTGFTVDTPIRVARYGLSSVISLVDDTLIEEMRRVYSTEYGEPYTSINKFDDDWRARRITAYLDLTDRIVKEQFEALRASEFSPRSEITKYFELLPYAAPLKQLYNRMLAAGLEERARIQTELRRKIVPGWINVNIMTKLDRANVDQACEPLPEIYSDALAALRGYARSTVSSGIVLSAGLNRRLYSYFSEFSDFFADETGQIKKQIILKVSDYRSAVIQGKFFAKKGLWVSEYRIESGLNCGGHAFAGNGNLIGPVLAELSAKRRELTDDLGNICREALKTLDKPVPEKFEPFRLTAQGGIGTAAEDAFLRRHYGIDSTGWGTPFLLVPEATQVEPYTLTKLIEAREEDIYLSDVSPLGVPFHNLRASQSEVNKRKLIDEDRPGSPCPLGHLVSNTEFTEQPICTASRQYQSAKLEELKTLELPDAERAERVRRVMAKACICSELGDTAYVLKGIAKKGGGAFPAICPGPNIAYFDRVATLRDMVDHIYGRLNLLTRDDRPHMFIKELYLNIDFLANLIRDVNSGMGDTKDADIEEFRINLAEGIEYYRELMPALAEVSPLAKERILAQIEECRQRLTAVISTLLDAPLRRKLVKAPAKMIVVSQSVASSSGTVATGTVEITLLIASHTGNGKNFAKRVEAQALQAGFKIKTVNMSAYKPADLVNEKNLLVIISTYGEGDPPVTAEAMFEFLKGPNSPKLDSLRFSVLALGDKTYVHFCKAGVDLDAMLEKQGGRRFFERVNCDVDFNDEAERWLKGVFGLLSPQAAGASYQVASRAEAGYSAKHPNFAPVLAKINLNGAGSTKKTYHIELSVEGSGMDYQPGDACGIVSRNSDRLVDQVLSCLKLSGMEVLSSGQPVAEALKDMELTVLSPPVIQQYNAFAKSHALEAVLGDAVQLREFLHGRDFIDLVKEYPVAYEPEDILKVLRPVPPRLYSIASAPAARPGKLDILVGAVRYEALGRVKEGMASTCLADRISIRESIPIFIRPNEGFRLPEDRMAPVIMVGPGTGVAPFRAFIQQRALQRASGPIGKSWLFFGNPHAKTDFFYRGEWDAHLKSGVLTRLTAAFSRDQKDKVYVTHRILEQGKEIHAWLEAGAFVYVSGGKDMAHGVFDALVHCAAKHGRLTPEKAAEYGTRLRRSGRYLEDVY